jgi:hypothetical protein
VACYVFVDAELPHDGRVRAHHEFFDELRALYESGDAFPNWTDSMLQGLIPDEELRRRVLDEMRPQPWRFWTEPVPAFDGWDHTPGSCLRFKSNRPSAYDAAAEEARERGWPCAEIRAGHFHMLVDPAAVASAILELVARAEGIPTALL